MGTVRVARALLNGGQVSVGEKLVHRVRGELIMDPNSQAAR